MKSLLTVALAAVFALVLGVGAFQSTPSAQADADGIIIVGCELLAAGIDGDTEDDTAPADYALCGAAISAAEIVLLDDAYGDGDGNLTADDLAEQAALDANQLPEDCQALGFQCTLLVFAFVDDEGPVTLDLDADLASAQGATEAPPTADFVCDTEAAHSVTEDEDCSNGVAGNGDGVVVFHVYNGTPGLDAGESGDAKVIQEGVEVGDEINVVGEAHEVELTLVEDTVQRSGTTAASITDCLSENDVRDGTTLSQAETTLAVAVVRDLDGTPVTRVTVSIESDDEDIANVDDAANTGAGESNADTGVLNNTGQSVDAGDSGIAQFATICGGRETGTVDIVAEIDDVRPPVAPIADPIDRSTAELTVVGEPAEIVLAAAPASIACDGSASSEVTATVTDSDGNNVANGTEVRFNVVALGTADPINTETTDGVATSSITPLSNASAGVTVIVTAGEGDDVVERSIRVDCSLPIPPQPSGPTGPVPTPTRPGGIVGPDTGNGGYASQDSGFPMWTLIALAIGSVALVAGGVVTRKVTK